MIRVKFAKIAGGLFVHVINVITVQVAMLCDADALLMFCVLFHFFSDDP